MRRRDLLRAAAAVPAAPFVPARAQGTAIEWPTMRLLDGRVLGPEAWQGMAAIVVFWATWCPYCTRHNAHVTRLHRTSAGQRLRVLGVALDDDADAVRRHMARHGLDFPVTLDAGDLRQRLAPRRVVPTTCVLDHHARLLQAIPGEMAEADVLDLAQRLPRPPA